jgi:hypothetical protein
VTVPAEVLLSFIGETNANPIWLLTGEGDRFRRGGADAHSNLSPIQLIRLGLEKLEQQPVQDTHHQLSTGDRSPDFVTVSLVPFMSLADCFINPSLVEGQVLAYREWLPHPRETVAVRLPDESMFPVLPAGSVVAVDRSIKDPRALQGKMVAANPDGLPMIRWLDISGRHMIFRPNQASRDYPLIPLELNEDQNPILGQIVWSWSRFNDPIS